MACIIGRHVREGHVFHEKMSYGRTCLARGHVLQVDMSSGGQVLQEDMYCGKSCIMGTCIMGDMYYGGTCHMRGHVFMMTCLVRF